MTSIDVNSLVAQLMVVEAAPLRALQAKEKAVQTKINAIASAQGAVSALQTAAEKLAKPEIWKTAKASVIGEGVSAAVTDSSKVAAGRYSIKVDQLAASHAMVSGVYADRNAQLGGGTLTLKVGEGDPVQIKLEDGKTSLADIRDAINGAKAGVTATVITDESGSRLSLVANETGAKNRIEFSVSPDSAGSPLAGLVGGMSASREPVDAIFHLNGLKLSSASNKVSEAIEGVTLDLRTADKDKEVHVDITRDSGAMKSAVEDFVKTYNSLNSMIGQLAGYNAETKVAGPLSGDAMLRGLQSEMRSLLKGVVGGGEKGFASLSEVGIAIQADGTLKLDEDKFNKALEKPDALATLFVGKSDKAGEVGIAVRFKQMAESFVGDEGVMTLRTKSLKRQVDGYVKDAERMNARLDETEKRLKKQYAALDVQLSAMQNQSVALANALAGLPGAIR